MSSNGDNSQNDIHDDAGYDSQEQEQDRDDISKDQSEERRPETELEHSILNDIAKAEKKNNYEDKISQELEEKLSGLQILLKGKNEQEILNIRMHQLALSKILVFTHGKSQFRLVLAHCHIGQAYLNYKCYEQAIDHLTIAVKKNGKLFDIKDTKVYHAHILTLLGRCYYEIGSYEDALELLNKAREIQAGSSNENELNFTKTLILISNCYSKTKDYANAMSSIEKVINIVVAHLGQNSQEGAFAFIEKANIYALQEDYKEAEKYHNKAIETLIEINYKKPDYVAELYQTLGSYQEKLGDIQAYQTSLQKVKSIYEQMYTPNDKRVIKTRRQISIVLLKNQKFKEALDQLHVILDLEKKVFGESSVQVAKTLKLLGSVYLTLNELAQSQNYLKQAQKIFSENGQPKAASEIKTKLKYAKDVKENKRPALKLTSVKDES